MFGLWWSGYLKTMRYTHTHTIENIPTNFFCGLTILIYRYKTWLQQKILIKNSTTFNGSPVAILNFMLLFSQNSIVIKKSLATDFKYCIKVCLGHTEKNVVAFNNILVNKKFMIFIMTYLQLTKIKGDPRLVP